eukprot:5276339-Prymnesium_polylepis.2
MQLADINLFDAHGTTVSVASASAPCITPASQPAQNAVDNDVTTKWLCRPPVTAETLTFTLSAPSLIRSYELVTAGDIPARDPTSWTLECGADATNYQLLDSVIGFQPPVARLTSYGVMSLLKPPSTPPPPLPPTGPPPPLAPPEPPSSPPSPPNPLQAVVTGPCQQ